MLFPEFDSPKRVGIARAAAESECVGAKRVVRYLELPTRRYLNRVSSDRVPFRWSINPYRGCEIGCHYCYARFTHEFMELRGSGDFERRIFVKAWDEAAFRAELKSVKRREQVAIGTASDPYQAAERRFGLTRRILGVFAWERGWRLGLVTKSDLVVRDIDLLREVSERNRLEIALTITTLDDELARKLEPQAARPGLRMEAVRKLSAAGLHVGVFANPVMPMLTDGEESLDRLMAAAAEAGAKAFHAGPLFLMPSTRDVMLRFLDEHFPFAAARYRDTLYRRPFLCESERERLAARVARLKEKHGFTARAEALEQWAADGQLELFGGSLTVP